MPKLSDEPHRRAITARPKKAPLGFTCFAVLVLSTITQHTTASAQNRVAVIIEAPEPLVEVKGMEYTDKGVSEISTVEVKQLSERQTLVSFPVASPNTLSGAMGRSANGTFYFSPLARAATSTPYQIPACSDPDLTYEALHDQGGSLRSLLEIRVQRRTLLSERIAVLIKQLSATRLARLEQGLGVNFAPPLGDSASILEIFKRTVHLTFAIRAYRYALERANSARENSERSSPPK